ncbi:MAG: RHS repeat-associated core domain-containing protein [Candidatus Omnitrophica bacterium]|nr:RHS repeat-associated core domain-containing protein [Candidatus Omnitrophota bacterium]
MTSYSYDTENRLKTVIKGGATVGQYTYDGDGGRSTKTAGGATTIFIGAMYEETNATPTKNIFLGGQRIASINTQGAYYYLTDHLGGTNVLMDSSGVKKELIEYDPYGSYARHDKYGDSDEVARFYFTGKKLDDESGLYFFEARYYDSKLGRFITPDTIVQSPSNPQTLNRYSYCGNNPVNRVDPSGHKWSWTKFWHAAVGAFVGVVATILLGPVGTGFFATFAGAGAFGGALGGAISGGLDGGWRGALIGGAMGGALGGLGGWAYGESLAGHAIGNQIMGGMLAAGVGIAAATNSWDSFAGGLTGAVVGSVASNGIIESKTWKNWQQNRRLQALSKISSSESEGQKSLSVAKNTEDDILNNKNVQDKINQAWDDSFNQPPYGGPGGATYREQGGFIYQDANGQLDVARWPSGNPNSYQGITIPHSPEGTIALFHTHPFASIQPSSGDYIAYGIYGMKGYIIGNNGVSRFTPDMNGGKWDVLPSIIK